MSSAEFTSTYGNINTLSNTQFVTLLYNNVLDRAPDSGGLATWVNALNAGTLSRVDVLLNFSDSAEHINLMNTGLGNFMRGTMAAWTDTIEGGPGDDLLGGGKGSDRFIFTATDGGTDRIYGFENFDTLEFRGFGFYICSKRSCEYGPARLECCFHPRCKHNHLSGYPALGASKYDEQRMGFFA